MIKKSLFDYMNLFAILRFRMVSNEQSNGVVVVELMNKLLLLASSSLFPFNCRSIYNRVYYSIPLIQLYIIMQFHFNFS